MREKLFDRVALIGIGLIGSSLARALRRDSPGTVIVACARRSETLATVRRLELADETTDDPANAATGADLVVIATPLSAYAEIGRRIAPALQPGAILTDVGSVKQAVIRDLQPHLPPGVHFVPGHPVAGTEHSGPEAGFAELFRGRWCILIPLRETAPEAVVAVCASTFTLTRRAHASRRTQPPSCHQDRSRLQLAKSRTQSTKVRRLPRGNSHIQSRNHGGASSQNCFWHPLTGCRGQSRLLFLVLET